MICFSKVFRIPGPKDLGMSDHNNAMPTEFFRNSHDEYTWEQYYARVKEEYPVRFFFAFTLPTFFRDAWNRIAWPIQDVWYWIVSHTIRRYHLVDIRQPLLLGKVKNIDAYRYGWIDTDTRIVYAMMNLLCEFVENKMPHGYFIPSEEEAAKDDGKNEFAGYRQQRAYYLEFMAIYNYWKHDRHKLEAEYEALLHEWSNVRSKVGRDDACAQELWDKLNAAEGYKNKKLDDMLHRLIAIRHVLWT